jgi:hypothetical protein
LRLLVILLLWLWMEDSAPSALIFPERRHHPAESTMQAIKLYNFPRSGHAHRVQLMLSLLQLPTIADVSAYSYIAHAPEGNVSLDDYANIRAWLARIEALPGFVGMPRTIAGLQKTA